MSEGEYLDEQMRVTQQKQGSPGRILMNRAFNTDHHVLTPKPLTTKCINDDSPLTHDTLIQKMTSH